MPTSNRNSTSTLVVLMAPTSSTPRKPTRSFCWPRAPSPLCRTPRTSSWCLRVPTPNAPSSSTPRTQERRPSSVASRLDC
ncbi:hypothetical protein L596_010660 [Steinernema carpocapsae]|uniref:Uncharacterized protein n=1 Tax=Steinernema carpocapsae TaxID=34508 RepID=A0A4U5PJM0_STECR|nr:hypothetical protein L596_010660 [Steinernema carpocapsae]